MSSLSQARRSWRAAASRSVARQQGRCSMCGSKDKTGLMEGKCTGCFLTVQQRIEQGQP